ncbi:pleckstrin homology domain-containing family H member 3-like [Salvelinus sp. IW2-2015]|uniref:pleckstrin homology domain-containing family H member 3-like n=1 Tax=Salvelinus sp. IW2-2015 TaxID=2691554 RepID=UPI000CEAA681|nr:pleckstrin homology domain-containing family H member 3-like [Salvelinus alpinus]
MPVQGFCWFLCCRQGFNLLGRDYGEKEEEESFELRNKEDLTCNGRGPLEVTLSQPTRTANGTNGHSLSEVPDEMKSLIIEKSKMGLEEDPELLVKGEPASLTHF